MEDKKISGEESLHLINRMIYEAKGYFYESGISALVYGFSVLICAILTYLKEAGIISFPFAPFYLFVPIFFIQAWIQIKEDKKKKAKTFTDEAIDFVWTGFFLSALAAVCGSFAGAGFIIITILLFLIGFAVFLTGLLSKFKYGIVCGVVCLLMAVISFFIQNRNIYFLLAAASIIVWIIPGFLMRAYFKSNYMTEDNNLTGQQSLELITQMINKAKCDYEETGIGAIMWGSLVTFCSLVTFGNFYWKIHALDFIWFFTLAAVIPQIIISVRAAKKKYKSFDDDAIAAIWISFGIALTLVSIYSSKYQLPNSGALFLIMYGIPTFATGYINHFKPMITGGIICWVFAVICFYVQFPYIMLFTAAAVISAWLIPGLILRSRYKKAMQRNV